MILGRKIGKLSLRNMRSKKVIFLGNGMILVISYLSPYPMWKLMHEMPSHML